MAEVTHSVSGTHAFATTPEVQNFVLTSHSFENTNSVGKAEHTVLVRHQFDATNGDLAYGRYRR